MPKPQAVAKRPARKAAAKAKPARLNGEAKHKAAVANAVMLARAGFAVLPCTDDKRPAIHGGYRRASKDVREVEAMFWNRPWAVHVGIATGQASGVVVVDVDVPRGRDWQRAHRPNTLGVTTRSGGRHWFYRLHRGEEIDSMNGFAPGVDLRGEKGYVVAWEPLRLVKLARTMKRWPGFHSEHEREELASRANGEKPMGQWLPRWIEAEKLFRLKVKRASLFHETAATFLRCAVVGERHDRLRYVAWRVLAEGLDNERIDWIFREGTKPWSSDEAWEKDWNRALDWASRKQAGAA